MNRFDICNMALLNIGMTRPIASFTENSTEAQACGRVYTTAKKIALSVYPWKFATITTPLVLSTVTADGVTTEKENHKFAHVYAYPANAVRILNIGSRDDLDDHPQPYEVITELAGSMQTKYIATDVEAAYIKYIVDANEEMLSPQFVEALSWKVAGMVGMGMAKTVQSIQFCNQMYELCLDKAKQAQYLETEEDVPRTPRYIEQRGGAWCGNRR